MGMTAVFFLFGLSLFTSKSGITLFGSLLVLGSLFKFDFKKAWQENPWIFIIGSFFPVALVLNLFSVGGPEASLKVIQSWTWPLYVLPFQLLLQDKKAFKIFLSAVMAGFLVACGMALYKFANEFGGQFDASVRVASFWDIGRWAYFLACSAVLSFAMLGHYFFSDQATKNKKIASSVLLVISLAILVLANSRAAWLGAAVGIGTLGISSKKYFKMMIALGLLSVLILAAVPGVSTRFKSSFSAKKENGVITSTDASNAGRLHMWKVNADFFKENLFFGTGFESAEKPLRAFISQQSAEYQKDYIDPEFSFKDQHNSYLWILVQMGLLFFVYFWGSITVLVTKSVIPFFKTQDVVFKAAFAVIASQLFMFIFYSAVSSYETLWFFPLLLILAKAPRKI